MEIYLEKDGENTTVPTWILEDVLNALRMAYNSNPGSNCEKRQTAQSYNFLNAYLNGTATEDVVNRIIKGYTSEKLDL